MDMTVVKRDGPDGSLNARFDSDTLSAIERDRDYRLLRRLEVATGETGVGRRDGTCVGVAVDVETTGIGEDDVIVELALRRFRFDPDGVIVKIDRPYAWLEDPGRPLEPDVVRLTGLTDDMVAGRSIDDAEAVRLLSSAEFAVAHNAKFDIGHVVRRLPGTAGLAWACSMADVDWRAAGFDGGRSLFTLLVQIGRFHGAHRAGDDVDAVIALLAHHLPSGRTALAEMLERARAPGWRFRAVGAAFEVKDLLRARGYRWDADAKEWSREVADDHRAEEEWWLARQIYAADARPRKLAPVVERVTWRERHAPRPRAGPPT